MPERLYIPNQRFLYDFFHAEVIFQELNIPITLTFTPALAISFNRLMRCKTWGPIFK